MTGKTNTTQTQDGQRMVSIEDGLEPRKDVKGGYYIGQAHTAAGSRPSDRKKISGYRTVSDITLKRG